MGHKGCLLIVDDDADFASTFADRLKAEGFDTAIASTGTKAMHAIREGEHDCVLLDITLPDLSGMDLIHDIAAVDAKLPIIMVTGVVKTETAVDAIKRGAYDYVIKPIDFNALRIKLANAVESRRAFRTIAQFEEDVAREHGFDRFIFRSELMKAMVAHLKQLSESDATVLITGDSGVGKELAARTIHYNGPRRLAPFVAMSCAAVPETLIENELFGHERGSFTDAFERSHGKFEYANGGTIFLDEIGDLPLSMQTKLLRVLQEKSFHRIGGVREIKADVRVIAATNRDLDQAVADGGFRSDLFYRLSVLPITLPALEERPEDVIPLSEHFLDLFSRKVGKPIKGFAADARRKLASYPWPGNVRELQNAIERAVVFAKGPVVRAMDISLGPLGAKPSRGENGRGIDSLEEVQMRHIRRVLEELDWNISKAAVVLGIGRDTLYRKIKQYGIKQNP